LVGETNLTNKKKAAVEQNAVTHNDSALETRRDEKNEGEQDGRLGRVTGKEGSWDEDPTPPPSSLISLRLTVLFAHLGVEGGKLCGAPPAVE